MQNLIHLAISSGEPAGIGPEVSYYAACAFLKKHHDVQISILGDRSLFEDFQKKEIKSDRLFLEHIALSYQNTLGRIHLQNAPYVLKLLDHGLEGCQSKQYHAIVTAPIQKSVINEMGLPFSGHTEYFAEKTNTQRVVMMLCGQARFQIPTLKDLRVALVTTHLPLIKVPGAITHQAVLETIQMVHHELISKFKIPNPQIKIAGLNPHAGESGHLGKEEIEIITPAIEVAQQLNINVLGPFPADTIFDVSRLDQTDAFIAMYHDQGLAPFKMGCFGAGVNVTLGLPMIRTSVDHGTALDIAGKIPADFGSMLAAIELAYDLAKNDAPSP